MFELIPESIFAEVLKEHLAVIDPLYFDESAGAILRELSRRVDEAYETCFLIIDDEEGRPLSTEILTDRRTANECARVCGPNASVGILLIGK